MFVRKYVIFVNDIIEMAISKNAVDETGFVEKKNGPSDAIVADTPVRVGDIVVEI